jgi:hypothetical protein
MHVKRKKFIFQNPVWVVHVLYAVQLHGRTLRQLEETPVPHIAGLRARRAATVSRMLSAEPDSTASRRGVRGANGTLIKLFNKNTQSNDTYFLLIFVYDMFRKIIFPSSGQLFLNIYVRKTTQIAMSIFQV